MTNMLTAYRRHQKGCPHRELGRKYRRCRCPIWADGILSGRLFRKSVDTRNWEVAVARIRDWEFYGRVVLEERADVVDASAEGTKQVDIAAGITRFMADAEARALSRGTLKKYRALLTQLEAFAAENSFRYVHQLDVDGLRRFRESWRDSAISATKKLERLTAVCRFWNGADWLGEGLTAAIQESEKQPRRGFCGIKPPQSNAAPTLPFSREEVGSLLEAIGKLGGTDLSRARMRALILLLRWSGLRIGDAVNLHESRIRENRLCLYTEKTGTHVDVLLPDFAIAAMDELPRGAGFYFANGRGSAATRAGNYRRAFRRLRELAGLPSAHPHQFRDTFACHLLETGTPIDRVSKMLGHRSVKITEKHYAPWVRGRQEQTDLDVQRSWAEEQAPAPAAKVVKFRRAG